MSSSLIPKVGSDVTASSPSYIHFALVTVSTNRAFPYKLSIVFTVQILPLLVSRVLHLQAALHPSLTAGHLLVQSGSVGASCKSYLYAFVSGIFL